MLLLCPALHLLETEMTVSRPSNKKRTRTLKNVEQTFFTMVVFAAVLRNRNPESENRDLGTGMKKIGSGIFLTFVLGTQIICQFSVADLYPGSGT